MRASSTPLALDIKQGHEDIGAEISRPRKSSDGTNSWFTQQEQATTKQSPMNAAAPLVHKAVSNANIAHHGNVHRSSSWTSMSVNNGDVGQPGGNDIADRIPMGSSNANMDEWKSRMREIRPSTSQKSLRSTSGMSMTHLSMARHTVGCQRQFNAAVAGRGVAVTAFVLVLVLLIAGSIGGGFRHGSKHTDQFGDVGATSNLTSASWTTYYTAIAASLGVNINNFLLLGHHPTEPLLPTREEITAFSSRFAYSWSHSELNVQLNVSPPYYETVSELVVGNLSNVTLVALFSDAEDIADNADNAVHNAVATQIKEVQADYETTIGRYLSYVRWRKIFADVHRRRPKHRASSFDGLENLVDVAPVPVGLPVAGDIPGPGGGALHDTNTHEDFWTTKGVVTQALENAELVLQPAGGPDLLGLLSLYPCARDLWIVGDRPLGRSDYQFWGHADAVARNKWIRRELRDTIGPTGIALSMRQWVHSHVHEFAEFTTVPVASHRVASPRRTTGTRNTDDPFLQQAHSVDGEQFEVFPMVLFMLSLTGHRVVSVAVDDRMSALHSASPEFITTKIEFVRLGDNVSEHPDAGDGDPVSGPGAGMDDAGECDSRGVDEQGGYPRKTLRYTEIKGTRDPRHTFTKLSEKLAAFLLSNSARLTTHMIGAEYMLFEDQFTDFRDFIATVSHSIVQDDTGLPFDIVLQHFERIAPLGSYVGPADQHYINASVVGKVTQLGLLKYYDVALATGAVGPLPASAYGLDHYDITGDQKPPSPISPRPADVREKIAASKTSQKQAQCLLIAVKGKGRREEE